MELWTKIMTTEVLNILQIIEESSVKAVSLHHSNLTLMPDQEGLNITHTCGNLMDSKHKLCNQIVKISVLESQFLIG